MKVAICDDEKKLRKDLRSLIEIQMDLSGGDYTIEEFEDGRDLAAAEKKKRYSDSVSGYRDAQDGRYGDGEGAPRCRMQDADYLCDGLSGFCLSGL